MVRTKCSPRQQSRIRYLDQDQLGALLRIAKEHPLRDRLLVTLAYRYGLRISEALALRTEDVNLKRAEITVQAVKGGTTRTYSIGRDLLTLLRRHRTSGTFLLASRQGEKLGRTRAWAIIKAMFAEAGIPPEFSPHSLRHSLAVGMLDAGLRLEDVKDALRHASIRSSEVYGALSPKARAAYQAVMERSGAIVKVRR